MGKVLKNAAKGIGSLFWKTEGDDDDSSDTPEAKGSDTKTSPSAVASTPAPMLSSLTLEKGKEDAQIKSMLVGALLKANKPGYDYFEFAQAVEEQAKIIPAEETRFQATYHAVKSTGISQASLITDANYYLDVLKQEEKKFSDSMEGLTKQNVSSKEAELADIDKQTAEKNEQIKKLTDEINQVQKRKTELSDAVTANKIKIEQLKSNFAATLKIVTDKISGDVEKIKKYIPA